MASSVIVIVKKLFISNLESKFYFYSKRSLLKMYVEIYEKNFVFQHASYCNVSHRSFCVISY